jgi:hypothetical protein
VAGTILNVNMPSCSTTINAGQNCFESGWDRQGIHERGEGKSAANQADALGRS